jgi:Zn-dependent peptidase ImmA (M78 family)/DNA-binding XRE family transcriptional regulator
VDVSTFTPSRLSLARRRRGLTKSALALRVGLSIRSISSYEAGDKTPSDETTDRLAQALEFPRSFFAAPEISEIAMGAASFRKLSTLAASNRDRAVASGTLATLFLDWLDTRFDLPGADLDPMERADPETAALALRNRWGLGEYPAPNMVHLVEAHGGRVFSLAEECREIDAFSLWQGSVPMILLNTMKSGDRGRFDVAHELGHLTLHPRSTVPQGRDYEREADMFASAFLMPRGAVLAQARRQPDLDSLLTDKRRWGVSAGALLYRMRQLGLVTEWRYRSLWVEMSRLGYRTAEPYSVPRETSLLLAKVFASLRANGVSRRDIAADLRITSRELEGMVFGLVLTTQSGDGESGSRGVQRRVLLQLVETMEEGS